MANEVLEKIASAGLNGIKRAELKRTFGKNCESVIESLIEKQEIFIEKKGNAYFVWTKENYVSHIAKNDSKLKLAQNMETKTNVKEEKEKPQNNIRNTINTSHYVMNSDMEFKSEFDRCLANSSTSIGWTPFSLIRKKICDSKHISSDHFYTLVSELVERHRENYEISSGGQEGIMMRGLVHGFVRNI
jgi:hypothetical protein